MMERSSGSSLPGLSRMWSGMATLPMSCSSTQRSSIRTQASSITDAKAGRRIAASARTRTYFCIRSRWPLVSWPRSSAILAIAKISTSWAWWAV